MKMTEKVSENYSTINILSSSPSPSRSYCTSLYDTNYSMDVAKNSLENVNFLGPAANLILNEGGRKFVDND